MIRPLSLLEEEAIYILREAAAQFERPTVLFSGGKDSMCLLHLCQKAFLPSNSPFLVLHIDTGHNFPETLAFRDNVTTKLGMQLIVRGVEESIRKGRVKEDPSNSSRNTLQTQTLLDAIAELKIDAAIGGGRRDEEKSRAKEKFFSIRQKSGGWDPAQQRLEAWNFYNGHLLDDQSIRVFPLNNWSELDVWRYIQMESIEVPSLYFSHRRRCVITPDQYWLPESSYIKIEKNWKIIDEEVRFRTVGDMTCSSPFPSKAKTIQEVIKELEASCNSERSSRLDDKSGQYSMEDRKRQGYF